VLAYLSADSDDSVIGGKTVFSFCRATSVMPYRHLIMTATVDGNGLTVKSVAVKITDIPMTLVYPSFFKL
jgi:hypothetical protein